MLNSSKFASNKIFRINVTLSHKLSYRYIVSLLQRCSLMNLQDAKPLETCFELGIQNLGIQNQYDSKS